jgi:predicted PurR-regulated permease PerM
LTIVLFVLLLTIALFVLLLTIAQTIQWSKEGQIIQWSKEEGQTIQWSKEGQTIQWSKDQDKETNNDLQNTTQTTSSVSNKSPQIKPRGLRYINIETKEVVRIGYNGFLFLIEYSGEG